MKEKGEKNKEKKKQRGDASYSESMGAKSFCCVLKLGFILLICKASLIFNSNLELALSIILKERIIRIIRILYEKIRLILSEFCIFFHTRLV